ncbi:MAG: cytochrome P450 [Altererythrobacter sp. XM-24bin4]|jgi:cytochrome P450|uniref:Cytochrome P450 n=1 Tax=Altererythrobacter rubellus TaxID=2173831 RepID=A0A9Y2F5A4_9SPHN|nr:cytochrome P450 [Altererythrobacter rubellus]PWL25336.1 MAG: cytochrome P450 [Altererythrobacter sp. XM-24bin4]WIW96008.1 cytochrome P450 [Altererythrobacter rubellus]
MNKPAGNLFAPETLVDPFDYYREAHEAGVKLEFVAEANAWVVYSYELVSEVTAKPEIYSNDFASLMGAADDEIDAILAEGWDNPPTLLTADHPIHTRNRKLVNLAFSAPRVNAIEADMRKKSIELIAKMAEKGSGDFVEDFAIPLPVAMIAQQIGLDNDPKQVKDWSDAAVDRFSQLISRERELECARSFVDYQRYMKGLIDDRRANGGDDLLTDLVEARVEGETPLTDEEIMSIMQQFMVAGNETTTSTIAGGLLQLIRNPDQMAKAKAAAGGRDPKLIQNMVEEMLRYESPSAGIWRVVKKDVELGGEKIAAGSMLQVRYAAANRDPAKFEDPDAFLIDRKNARAHLAFGKGPHMCVGNMLSRKEMFVAFDELLERLDNFQLADEGGITVLPNIMLRGVTKLPITYEVAK